jgi:hypothetical protein
MPGGHANLRKDYFGTVTLTDALPDIALSSGEIIEGWTLQGEGTLALVSAVNGAASLVWMKKKGDETIAEFSADLREAAREFSITPIGLALLALAMGGVDDIHLKKCLPEVHKASKGLLLIAACRLCG